MHIPEVPAQHICAAEFPRAPWDWAPDRLLAPHPLGLVAVAWPYRLQVICDYYLLVDVMGALEVQAEAPCLKGLFAHVAYDCLLSLFPCSDAFPQASIRVRRQLDPYFPRHAHHCLRLLRVGGKADVFECLDKDVESLLEELSIP